MDALPLVERRTWAALVFEQDPDVAEALRDVLSEAFSEVTVAPEARGWRDALGRGRFALLLLDLDMGAVPVEQLVPTARLLAPEIVCGAILGWWDEREPDARSWAQCVVHKPLRPEEVREAVLDALATAKSAAL